MGDKLLVTGFKGFGGKHCETAALKKVLDYYDISHSEEFLFGLGSGIGFIYWYMKMMPGPFIGGRMGKVLELPERACERLGVGLEISSTTSSKKGYEELKRVLGKGAPAIVYGDMVYLPYFALPEMAHFGGHAFVVYGIDEDKDVVYISDRPRKRMNISLEDLAKARGSKHPPFPPKHTLAEIVVKSPVSDLEDAIKESIRETVNGMLRPPIKNLGLAGMEKWAGLVTKWPDQFKGMNLVGCLMNGFIYIEISGTGGSAFRPMYARFLDEAAEIISEPELKAVAKELREAGKVWGDIAVAYLPDSWPNLARIRGLLFEKDKLGLYQTTGALEAMRKINRDMDNCFDKAVRDLENPPDFLEDLREKILKLQGIETEAFEMLEGTVKKW